MKYRKVLQVLMLATAVSVAVPSVIMPAYALEAGELPEEYEQRTAYSLPEGYHYVLEEGCVILDENDQPMIEADDQTQVEPEISDTEVVENPGDGSEALGEGEEPENPENPGEGEEPGNPAEPGEGEEPGNPAEPGEGEEPENPENPGEGEEPENPENPGEGEEPENPEEPGEGEEPENPEEPANPEVPDGIGHPLTPEEPEIPEIPQETPEETAQSDPSEIFEDFENSYLTSAQFLAIRDRIQYNVEVPIEGLPSFITQEMIVGALKAQDEAGIPASVTIAQIIQESGFGKYGPGGDQKVGLSYLAYQYCNLFGIKGKGTAGSTLMNTFEMTDSGEIYHIQAGFRAYHTYTECIEDRTKLLTEKYADLTEGVKDANTFAMRIGSRWATDIHYGRSLIRTMKTYDLYRLDDLTLTDFSKLMGRFANPCPGSRITSTYGYRTFDNSFHKGLDLGTGKENIPTYAAEAGTVTFVGEAGSAGNLIIIDHGEGLVTKYMHHAEMYVEEGQEVEKGQQIGLSGTTGNSTGNHLHFQVEENGKAVDPLTYLQEEDEKDKEIGELRTMSRRSKFHRLKYKV